MSLNRYSTKRDKTEPAIRQALCAVGADFVLLDPFDVLVLFRGQLFMLECKSPGGKRTRNQDVLVERGWPLHFVKTPDEALKVIGAMR